MCRRGGSPTINGHRPNRALSAFKFCRLPEPHRRRTPGSRAEALVVSSRGSLQPKNPAAGGPASKKETDCRVGPAGPPRNDRVPLIRPIFSNTDKKRAACGRALFTWLFYLFSPISRYKTAFWAWRRFSASSKISSACFSKVSAEISSPLWAGRQCCTMAPGWARAISASLTW